MHLFCLQRPGMWLSWLNTLYHKAEKWPQQPILSLPLLHPAVSFVKMSLKGWFFYEWLIFLKLHGRLKSTARVIYMYFKLHRFFGAYILLSWYFYSCDRTYALNSYTACCVGEGSLPKKKCTGCKMHFTITHMHQRSLFWPSSQDMGIVCGVTVGCVHHPTYLHVTVMQIWINTTGCHCWSLNQCFFNL